MSWFNHVSQGLNQQQPHPIDGGRLAATDVLNSRLRGPAEGSPTMATHHWTGSTTPSPGDFPPAPQGVYSPPSLGNLSCAPPSAGRLREPEPISYVSLQEQRCVLSWFQGWNAAQRERFLQDLLGKAVPGKVCTLLDSLSTLEVKDRLPNIYECQLRLWSQWFESWGEEERNHFLHILEEQDPVFVGHFYRSVAGTSGRD
ncbi:uncharacterized protein C14orf119 homolog [Gasterosteus aculeatus]|uniref:Uncharacterized protein n=1 Tax=Gasterosteus aculeatus aculeatus TaxID=481459 RepID=G3PLT4_GASAC|nr:uncharacterized protein C14orf119 homolog [Gasterosteus aculeatus aculeatus]